MFEDPRKLAAVVLLSTLGALAARSWSALPYFPIEFSQMAWTSHSAHRIMTTGFAFAGAIMFKYHEEEGSRLGMFGAVCMVNLALINGDATAAMRAAHGIVALSCFVVYTCYIWINGGPRIPLAVAAVCIAIGHLVIFTQFDFAEFRLHGLKAWHDVWEKSQLKFPMWVRQVKALTQWTMITALYYAMFSVPDIKTKAA